MTFHTTSKRQARGSTRAGPKNYRSPRIALSFEPDEFCQLAEWAAQHGRPFAWAVREAVHCYLLTTRYEQATEELAAECSP